jgi:hypothetical protein
MIRISSSLLLSGPNVVRITGQTPLGNPFKLGDTHIGKGIRIETSEDIQSAYAQWFHMQIKQQNPVVIKALDAIAYREIDGGDTILICSCNKPTCHGYIIKDVVETKLKELNQ